MWRQFIKFGIVGTIGFVVDSAVLYLGLYLLGLNLYSGRLLSYLVAATATWALNRIYTFSGSARREVGKEWSLFLIVNSLGGLANYGVYAALVSTVVFFAQIPVLAVASGSIAGLVFNFSLSRTFVFNGKNSSLEDHANKDIKLQSNVSEKERSIPGGVSVLAVFAAASVIGTLGLVVTAALGVKGGPVIALMLVVLTGGLIWTMISIVRDKRWPSLLGYVTGMLPMLAVAIDTPVRHWDDFMTWLPAAEYIRVFQSLPVAGGPTTISGYPGYPPGLPVLLASVSTAAGHFISNLGGVINVGALAVLGSLVAGSVPQTRRSLNLHRFVWTALAALAATFGNPGIAWHVVLSSLPDVVTAVAIACLAWLAVRFWLTGTTESRSALLPATVFGLILALLLSLRQTGLVEAVLLCISIYVVAVIRNGWRGARPWPGRSIGLLLAFAPGLAAIVAWRLYVAIWLPKANEFVFKPIAQWNWSLLPDTFASIGIVAKEHWGLSLITITLTIYGLRYLHSRWSGAAEKFEETGEAGALAAVFAILWLLYSGFLVFCYLAAFIPDEAARAAEFFRYQSHVLELGVVVTGMLAVRIIGRRNLDAKARIRSMVVPVCLGSALIANIFTRPSASVDWPVFIRYAAGCDCIWIRPSEADAIVEAANSLKNEFSVNSLGRIVLEMDNSDHFKGGFIYFIVRFTLWQDAPRPVDVLVAWENEDHLKQKLSGASEHIEFATKSSGCDIVISHNDSGVWREKTRIQAPSLLLAQCRQRQELTMIDN